LRDTHPVRSGIIATVVGGIILAILRQVWMPARDALAWLWGVLNALVPVPVWLLLFLFVAVPLIATARILRRRLATSVAPASVAVPRADVSRELSEFERSVLERIAKADGEDVDQDTIVRSLRTSRIRVQAAVDELDALDFVEVVPDYDDNRLSLTRRGRQYAVEHNMA